MPSTDFGVKGSRVQKQVNKSGALSNIVESPDQIEKQDYDLENYSFHNKRQSDQGSLVSNKNSSLLKNEILRKQQLPLNIQLEIKESMNEMKKELNQKIEKKQFEL